MNETLDFLHQIAKYGLTVQQIDEEPQQQNNAIVQPGIQHAAGEEVLFEFQIQEPDNMCVDLNNELHDDEEEEHLFASNGNKEKSEQTKKEGQANKKRNHHSGPMLIKKIEDKRARQKSCSKRKLTLIKKAKEVHVTSGSKVSLEIVTETGQTSSYYSHPKTFRHCGVQVGKPTLSPIKCSTRQILANTPKKIARSSVPKMIVENVPAKKTKSVKPKTTAITKSAKKEKPVTTKPKVAPKTAESQLILPGKRTTGRCKVCKRIYESSSDDEFRKQKGMRNSTWVGCDKPKCSFWAHACCAKLRFKPRIPIEKQTFFCEEHR